MQTVRRSALALFVLVLATLSASAQTPVVVEPTYSLKLSWDAPIVDASGADAPSSYIVETFRADAPTTVLTSVSVPYAAGPPPTVTMSPAQLPATGTWLIAVRAKNATGTSDRSNALPFVRPSAPRAPTGLTAQPIP